jgi:predicted enzyme related to lactoylglutathione lyase
MFSVSDLGRSVAFYRKVLGLRCEIESIEYQWAEFDCGNVTLSLRGNAVPNGASAGGQIALAVEDVLEAYDEIMAAGLRVEMEPIDSGFCVALKVRDPDGNLVILHRRTDGTYGQNQNVPAKAALQNPASVTPDSGASVASPPCAAGR